MNKRGMFIVFEGIDRSGKTTQSKLLVSVLRNSEYVRFPNRDSITGRVIDEYLKRSIEMNPQVNHLLFSANRWETISEIEQKLAQGINIICDRYIYSGTAYSIAKGLDYAWCKTCDDGLIEPDIVFYLDLSPGNAKMRGEYGSEVFENEEFQLLVQDAYYGCIIKDDWNMIDASKDVNTVHNSILANILDKITLK